jgi:hypothetical protein
MFFNELFLIHDIFSKKILSNRKYFISLPAINHIMYGINL